MIICNFIIMSKKSTNSSDLNSKEKSFVDLSNRDLVLEKKDSGGRNVVRIDGEKFIDTEGGFLLPDSATKNGITHDPIIDDLLIESESNCIECKKQFLVSFLLKHFDHSVCDGCRDNNDKHSLITRTDAKQQYLLKDCDFDSRDPPLKFILRKNPHNVRWGQMKLYLHLQIEKRALEVWGSFEKLEEAHEQRDEKRVKAKTKKYNKNLKALRMEVRSSLYNRISGPTHIHEFGPENYNQDEDNYSKACLKCNFVEIYEKM